MSINRLFALAKEYAYKMGIDCGKNGPNKTNCHFTIFSKPEHTEAWEKGKKEAEDQAKP